MAGSGTSKRPLVWTVVVLLGVAAVMAAWYLIFNQRSRTQPLDLVTLLATLATDANKTVNDPAAVVRAPFFGVEPIGTLIAKGAGGVSRRCHPLDDPQLLHPPGFPPQRYALKRDAAASLTFGLLGGANAAVDLGTTRSIELDFDDVVAHLMMSDEVAEMVKKPECNAAVGGRPLQIVVGYIEAKRTFRLDGGMVDKAKITRKETSFTVDAGSGNGKIEVSDKASLPLFEIISELPAGTAAAPAKPVLTTALAVGGTVRNGAVVPDRVAPIEKAAGRIYIQRDERDDSGRDLKLVAALSDAGLPVVRTVERMPSDRSPARPSIRYFNDADRPRADQVAVAVNALYPDAQVQRFPFAAPAGQIELWLPQVPPTASPGPAR